MSNNFKGKRVYHYLDGYTVRLGGIVTLCLMAPFFTFMFGVGTVVGILEHEKISEISVNLIFFLMFATVLVWGAYVWLKWKCPVPTKLIIDEEGLKVWFLWKCYYIPWEGIEGFEDKPFGLFAHHGKAIFINPEFGKNFLLHLDAAKEIEEIWKEKRKKKQIKEL
jgi:hypothetical protein